MDTVHELVLAKTRSRMGFLTSFELVELFGKRNTILDPYSCLISKEVQLGEGNVFYPNVVIQAEADSIKIGGKNTFLPGTFLHAAGGTLVIGDDNQFGAGGCVIQANHPKAEIVIGNGCRFLRGAELYGRTVMGDGAQVLGPITVQDCILEGGESFRDPDPDKRAAVLKGFGTARGLHMLCGYVINGKGDFQQTELERQNVYHPKKST